MENRSGFSEADLTNATRKIEVALDKVEAQLAQSQWLAGDMFTLADVNFYAHCGMMVERMFPDLKPGPRLIDWRDRTTARPGVAAALEMPDHTNPALRTFTGHVQ
jgi:glutathione S-transferase